MSSPPVALVARATHPIGRTLAPMLAGQGFDVAVGFDQDDETAQGLAEAVEDEGQRAVTLPGRVGDPMAAESIVQRTTGKLGRLDRLAVMPRGDPVAGPSESPSREALEGVDLGQVETMLQADLKGPWVLLKAALEHGFENDRAGSVVIVGTTAPHRRGVAGVASRAADEALSELVATAGSALEPTVRVNGVRPGVLAPGSDGPEDAVEESDPEGADVDGDQAAGGQAAPARPSEVAGVVAHLLEAPARLTGQVVQVGSRAGKAGNADTGAAEAAEALAGIDKRIEPPDPEERMDLGDPGERS